MEIIASHLWLISLQTMTGYLWLMSLQACLVILIVLIARALLKKYPKVLSYSLWILVGLRLLCPVFVESPFSLQPDYEAVAQSVFVAEAQNKAEKYTVEKETSVKPEFADRDHGEVTSGVEELPLQQEELKKPENSELSETRRENISKDNLSETEAHLQETDFGNSIVKPRNVRGILIVVYLAGAVLFAAIYVVRYLMVMQKIQTAVRQEGNVWCCDCVASPFVIGMIRPKIILPFGLTGQEVHYIVLHEKTHLKHYDPMIRFIGVVCLCLHWWNPLVWLAVHYMNKDMEMFCDESVLKEAEQTERKAYAETLLTFAARRSGFSVGLAFGESNAEQRIKNIVKKKRQSRIIMGAVGIAAVLGVVVLLTIPEQEKKISGAEDGGIVAITPMEEPSLKAEQETKVTEAPEPTNVPMQKKSAHVFSKSEVFVTNPVPDYSFENATKLGTTRMIKGTAPGTGDCIWYTVMVRGVAYYWCRFIENSDAELYSYAIFSEEYPLANGIRVGMTKEEVLSLYPDMAVVDIQGTAYEEDAAWNLGFDSTCYPESLEGQDEKLNYNGKQYWYWQEQFDYCLLAEIDGETRQGRAMALALMMKEDKVEAITFYCHNDGMITPAEWLVSIPKLWDLNRPASSILPLVSNLLAEEPAAGSEEEKILAKYQSVLFDLLREEKLPDGSESGAMLDMEVDSFAVCDVDFDGRDELLLWHMAPDTEAYMQAYVWEYKPETDSLHEEARITPFFKLLGNGLLAVQASYNHSYASHMGRYLTPYTLYQYDAITDTYRLLVTIEAWDKYYHDDGFPEKADMDGNGMVYHFTEEDNWQDDAAYEAWFTANFEERTEYVAEHMALTEENISALLR